MKIAYSPEDSRLIISDCGIYYQTLKSIGGLRWNKQRKTLEGIADLDTLNRLAGIAKLPPNIDAARKRMAAVRAAIDRERNNPEPEPLIEPKTTLSLFKHQVRGYNMALLEFGLVTAEEVMPHVSE